jgi:hypothetical protein
MAFSQIFPWINEFIRDLHVTDDSSRIGFYSGIVVSCFPFLRVNALFDLSLQESAFAIAQLISIYQWARVSGTIDSGLKQAMPEGSRFLRFSWPSSHPSRWRGWSSIS